MTDPGDQLLFDTSVWVRYLRARERGELHGAVQQALAEGRVATCWVVKSELLVGAKDAAAFETLLDVLEGLEDVSITPRVWVQAAQLGHLLRRQGLLLPLPDLLIAQCAISTGRLLWHLDADFERARERCSLRTRYWREDAPS